MVVAGLMSIVGLAITSVITNSTKSQKRIELKEGQISTTSLVRGVLQNAGFCANAFCTGGSTCTTPNDLTGLPTAAVAANFTIPLQGIQAWGGVIVGTQSNLASCGANCNTGAEQPAEAGPWGTPIGSTGLHIFKMRLINFSYQGLVGGNHTSTGELQIRYTRDPKKASGGLFQDSIIRLIFTADNSGAGRIVSCTAGSGDSLWQQSVLNSSDIFYSAGEVGIGNDSPLTPLNVTATNATRAVISADEIFQFHDAAAGAAGATNFGTVSNSTTTLSMGVLDTGLDTNYAATLEGGFVGTHTNAPLNFRTNALERMRIDINGNVGIGTITPGAPLSVVNATAQVVVNAQSGAADTQISINNTSGKEWKIGSAGATSGTTANSFYIQNFTDAALIPLTITAAGRVGIGQPSPAQALDVAGNFVLSAAGARTISTTTGNALTMTVPGNAAFNVSVDGLNRLVLTNTTATFANNASVTGTLTTNQLATGGLTVSNAATFNNIVTMQQNLSVTGSATLPTLSGDIVHTGSLRGSAPNEITGYRVISTSDQRLKRNIVRLTDQLDLLEQLGIYHFTYINDPTNKKHIGLMAQDLQKSHPELVTKMADGKLGVNYLELVPVLIKALQESNSEVKNLKSQSDQQLAQVEFLKTSLEKLHLQQMQMNEKLQKLLNPSN